VDPASAAARLANCRRRIASIFGGLPLVTSIPFPLAVIVAAAFAGIKRPRLGRM
jgi:hypothetical protein